MDLSVLDESEILALTLYGEARGEPIQGQIAVGCVIRNRADRKSYKDICLAPKQFSCWNEDDPNRHLLIEMAEVLSKNQNVISPDYIQCKWVAEGIINNLIRDITSGAKNYLTFDLFHSDKRPSWAKVVSNERQIGKQIFFNV